MINPEDSAELDEIRNLPAALRFEIGLVSSVEQFTQGNHWQVKRSRVSEPFREGGRLGAQMITMVVSSKTLPIAIIDPFAAFFNYAREFVPFFRSQRTRCAFNNGESLGTTNCFQAVDIVGRARQPIRGQRLQFLDNRFQFAHSFFKATPGSDPTQVGTFSRLRRAGA
jgi:hypothetical protein